jgi:hypothetical protein
LLWWGPNGDRDEIRAARVSSDGEVLDPSGITVAAQRRAEATDLAFGDSQFLVVWQERDAAFDAHVRGDPGDPLRARSPIPTASRYRPAVPSPK